MQKIILASGSPRRKQLLEWAEISFDVQVSASDESFPETMPVRDAPVYIARNKALKVQETAGREQLILAADTIVLLDEQIIGKPRHREDAISILTKLSGQTHEVITGVVMLYNGNEYSFSDTTFVTFHTLSPQQISYYVDHYQPYDKAGAYAIQEWIGVTGIHSISGDFYNVMGLPVSRVIQQLKALED